MPKKLVYLDQSVIDKIKFLSSSYGIKESQFVNLVLKKHFGDDESEFILSAFEISTNKDLV